MSCQESFQGFFANWFRNDAAVAKAGALGKEHGVKAVAYKVDGAYTDKRDSRKILTVTVSDPEAVQKTIANVVNDFGRIDVFIANAGTFNTPSKNKPLM